MPPGFSKSYNCHVVWIGIVAVVAAVVLVVVAALAIVILVVVAAVAVCFMDPSCMCSLLRWLCSKSTCMNLGLKALGLGAWGFGHVAGFTAQAPGVWTPCDYRGLCRV